MFEEISACCVVYSKRCSWYFVALLIDDTRLLVIKSRLGYLRCKHNERLGLVSSAVGTLLLQLPFQYYCRSDFEYVLWRRIVHSWHYCCSHGDDHAFPVFSSNPFIQRSWLKHDGLLHSHMDSHLCPWNVVIRTYVCLRVNKRLVCALQAFRGFTWLLLRKQVLILLMYIQTGVLILDLLSRFFAS